LNSFSPETFGKYFLVDKIAVGGMAEIFKAKTFSHGGFEKLLVIKRILAHLSENEEFVEMFVDEAKVTVALQHANIVQTYDFGKLHTNYFIAMECVEGKDVKVLLRKLAQRRKLLPIEFAVYVAHEVCKGLDYAHRRTDMHGKKMGIVHRDMSPSNVLISYEGEIKIADFGIAKAATNAYNTKDGVLKGKFEYMSPEQAMGQDIDRRSDLFSCGIILYECLTGRRLFKGSSEIKTLEAIKACDIDPPSVLNPAIPARLDEIVMQAMARDRSERYQEARELQNDLLEFLYPATPDLTRQSFSHFLKELFSEEIAQERHRLEEGTRLAVELRSAEPDLDLEPEWEEGGPGTSTTVRTEPSRGPVYALMGMVALLMLGVVGIFLISPLLRSDPVEQQAVTTGRMMVLVNVAAAVYVDDVLVGEGTNRVEVEELSAGDHQVRVEQVGYQAYEDIVTVGAGEKLRIPVRLAELAPQEPLSGKDGAPEGGAQGPSEKHQPRAASEKDPKASDPGPGSGSGTTPGPDQAEEALVSFRSTPPGASVFVNGRLEGRTPFIYKEGTAGESVSVEYRREGYRTVRFTTTVPEAGGASSETRSLQQAAVDPGFVSVNLDRSWAYVYIDGQKLADTTPVIKHKVKPGAHSVRLVNEALGIDETRSIEVVAGEVEVVFVKVK